MSKALDKTTSKSVGRPAINLDEYFSKIQPFLQLGYSFHKSCLFAEIPYTSLILYYNEDENFRNKCERERSIVSLTARRNLVNAIKGKEEIRNKDGVILQEAQSPSIDVSKEWLETQEKDDWSKRTETLDVTPQDEGIIILREIIMQGRKEARKELDNEPIAEISESIQD